jgi:hypothetical protein
MIGITFVFEAGHRVVFLDKTMIPANSGSRYRKDDLYGLVFELFAA